MRPTKLTIQGLTAYKQPVEIDFTDLDLFAITGPTGAGKSSLVDAITFALFGKAPRVGREVKELISQGEDRLEVELYFSSNGDQFRVHRTTARKGAGKIQFERYDKQSNDWLPEEDRVREANAAVEDVLQMDYEAFIRSVLLPQGQFQEFLAGDRDQRRKVLDGLLQLNVYAVMLQKANAIDRDKAAEADSHRRRLDNELADATPEALKAAKAQLRELRARADDLAALRRATDDARQIADALSDSRKREVAAKGNLDKANDALTAANDALAHGTVTLAAMDAEIAKVSEEITAAEYDGDLHLRLQGCLPLLVQVEDGEKRETKLTAEIEKGRADVEKLHAEVDAARTKCEAAATATETRHNEYEAARHTNATALLRQTLKKGDPCPVCGQPAPQLPKAQVIASDKLKAAWEKAVADERAATQKQSAAEGRVAVGQSEITSLTKQLKVGQDDRARIAARLASVTEIAGLASANVEKRIASLEQAKTQRKTLEEKRNALVKKRQEDEAQITGAKSKIALLGTEVGALTIQLVAASTEATNATKALGEAATQMHWDDVAAALKDARDVAPMLRGKLAEAQGDSDAVNREIGATEKHIEHIEKDIETAKAFRQQEKTCREEATLARDLASLLRADRFPAFLRERAMIVLAEAGSSKLREISGGRYDLSVKEQDFEVEDLWNAGQRRPVTTLSGGETFLASLALALALAENLADLSGDGKRSALESLFIDEGFSHLDEETLNDVASALEVLGQDRGRLIGVVTHVPALAERMPARIVVHKSQGGSTVTVE